MARKKKQEPETPAEPQMQAEQQSAPEFPDGACVNLTYRTATCQRKRLPGKVLDAAWRADGKVPEPGSVVLGDQVVTAVNQWAADRYDVWVRPAK